MPLPTPPERASQPLPATACAAIVIAAQVHLAGMLAATEMAARVAEAAEASIANARAAQRAAGAVEAQRAADVTMRDALALLAVAQAAQGALLAQLAEAERRRDRALAGIWQDETPARTDWRK